MSETHCFQLRFSSSIKKHAIVCTKIEPLENHTIDCQGKINVAKSNNKLFKGKVGPIFIVHMLAILFEKIFA